jgi:hypothetical protein
LNSFDRDRALTIMMYQTRNKALPWDDNVHSLRGLEEYYSPSHNNNHNNNSGDESDTKSSSSSSNSNGRRMMRKVLIQSVLTEQTRLQHTIQGQTEVALACRGYHMTSNELIRELIRGVSCSLSKSDKQRAIQIAQKDEKEALSIYNNCSNTYHTNKWRDGYKQNFLTSNQTPNNRRRYMSMVKGKINDCWANTSNKSINSTGTCGDRSTTSSNGGCDTTATTSSVQPQNQHSHHRRQMLFSQQPLQVPLCAIVPRRKNQPYRSSNDGYTNNDAEVDDDVDVVIVENSTRHNRRTIQFNDDHDKEEEGDAVAKKDTTTTTFHNAWMEQVTSPLGIIRQVVYETSKQGNG